METTHTTTENLNDLVFENRNKAYGAYAIRNSYNDNVSRALFITLLLSASLIFIPLLFSKNDKIISIEQGQVDVPKTFMMPVNLTPQTKPEPPIQKTQAPKDPTPKSDNTAYVASNNEKDVSNTTNETAASNAKGTEKGIDSSAFVKQDENPGAFVAAAPSNTPVAAPDVLPEFNGDLLKFLRSKIQYPFMALDNGTSGTVNLQFVVEKDGSINDIKVLRKVADGCTEEAVRVVKSMPKWKPGRNGGEPVRVLYNLPVKFIIK